MQEWNGYGNVYTVQQYSSIKLVIEKKIIRYQRLQKKSYILELKMNI